MDKEDEAREVKAKMLQATAVKEYCMQMLMYFGMVNVVYFVVSVVVFFRFNLNTGVKDASSVS